MALGRDLFLSKPVMPVTKYTFPDSYPENVAGTDFYIRTMTSGERSKFESQFKTKDGKGDPKKAAQLRERLCIACVCYETGSLMFTPDDLAALGDQDGRVVSYMATAAAQANSVNREELVSITDM